VTASDYKVIPILFVPNDLTPTPLALQFIDKQMQMIQRWYGEQLRDRTFDLEPARIVTGTQPLSYYYGDCYPPNPSCGWPSNLWGRIFADLSSLGYPWQNNRIHGVFLQNDGMGAPALGGGNQFLVGIDTDNVTLIEDCLYPGCASSVNKGGVAHELGHAFGLPHPADDPEGSPGKSVMGYGFYGFPRATFVNTVVNPEKDFLYASPFISTILRLKDGGFEDCLSFWNVAAGTPSCTSTDQRSGLSALQLAPNNGQYRVSQDVTALAGETYDVSGWLRITSQTNNFTLEVRVLALASSGTVLSTLVAGSYASTTDDWERFAISLTLPAGTASARIEILGQGLGATAYVDDIDFRRAQQLPPVPLPILYYDRDAVATLQPTLQWSDSTSVTAFRLQVSPDKSFNSLTVDTTTSSPFYTVPSGLAFSTRYFWRVKAINGTGESNWSITWSFIPRSGDDYHNDEFETGTLVSAWSWIREDSSHWYFGGPLNRRGYGYLGITTLAGDLQSGNNAKNLLLRNSPSGDFEVSTKVDFWEPPDDNYQQGGLLIYQDDQNYIKLTRIVSGTYGLELQVEAGGAIAYQYFAPIWSSVPIKIARTGNSYSGYYSADGIVWKRLGQPTTVNLTNPKIGLTAYSVLDVKQITAYFDWFRVTPRCYEITASVSPPSSGTIAKSPGDCNGGIGYSISSPVAITANPSVFYAFSSWSGDVTGTDNPTSVTMNRDKTITANFTFIGHKLFLPLVTKPGVNYAVNGSFEEGIYSQSGEPTGWTRDVWDWANAALTWDNAVSYEGSKSVKITASVPNDARWIQTVSLQPYTNYRLSGRIKTEGVAHADGSVVAGANLGLYGTWEHTTGLFGTNDWTTVSMQFNSGSNTSVTIACRLGYWSGTATGTMWCDDIRLEPIP
jgi:regulation of enolase protein 1 (concanavalin A-like superfamily)